jgi:hypothetical protein
MTKALTIPPLVAFLGRLQISDANGAPCLGARLCISGNVRGSGGGATEMMALYADAAHSVPLPNPVVADAAGMLPLIYRDSSPFDCSEHPVWIATPRRPDPERPR